MKQKYIIRSLPLLASILGRKYGVQVHIGGREAFTDGDVIQLPDLPLECGDALLGLIRGWIDHESAHIRDTDFSVLQAANLSPLEKHIWNIIEDWRAENKLASIYPGCRGNFQWLIRRLFLSGTKKSKKTVRQDSVVCILEWLLISVRSWDMPELDWKRDSLRAEVEMRFPGLTREIEPVLSRTRARCVSTAEAIQYAREIVAIVQRYAHSLEQPRQDGRTPSAQSGNGGQSAQDSKSDSGDNQSGQALQSLQGLLSAKETDLPSDISEQLRKSITGASPRSGGRTRTAICAQKPLSELSRQDQEACRQATTALRTRLQGMMQSMRSVRNHSGYCGVLDTRRLHTLAAGNARIFLRRGERISVNTAVHILLDSSGSMAGNNMALAGQACFAAASALGSIKGINIGVTAFPGAPTRDQSNKMHWHTVMPMLAHGQAMHSSFATVAAGGTPMDAAVWWALQRLYHLSEPRKIILLITDGEPDDKEAMTAAVKSAAALGVELYGIGIQGLSVESLLPEQRRRIIAGINDLAPAMFGMLRKALLPTAGK